MEEQKTELKMIQMSEVESQEVKWLWYPFIPYGKLTIIQGDPGDGKTTLVLNIAAKLSKGEDLDIDMNVQEPVNVIYQTAEDGLADTVKPRLELAGADCEKIWCRVMKFLKWLMNRTFQREHWKMQRKNWASGQRKSITRGIGNWMQ